MAFHAHSGWYFERLDDGSVQVTTPLSEVGIDGDLFEDERAIVVFDPNTWASIVASVCARGESADTFWRATRFHDAAA